MDLAAAWTKTVETTKSGWRWSATQTTAGLNAAGPVCAPLAVRWDAEADRRKDLRTPEHLKELIAAQRDHNTARALASQAGHQRKAARAGSKNPLSTSRRSARAAHRATQQQEDAARRELRTARTNYPMTLRALAVRAHAAHAVPGVAASAWMTEVGHHLTIWPGAVSAAVIAANAAALRLGRRMAVAPPAEAGLSLDERQLMERLDPSYWVQHAEDRGLSGTITGTPLVTSAGIECAVRLDGQWTVKKLRAASDSVRALLGARTDLPMLVAAGDRGGWGLIRLRTRSAAPDGAIPWTPGSALGVDMVTGEDVVIRLGQRMLIAGMSGSGKSTASRPLLFDASEGEANVLVIIDLKKVEARLWDHRARVAYTPDEVCDLVDELLDELAERLSPEVLPKGQATLVPTAVRPRITIVVDEGAEVMSGCTAVQTVVGWTEKGKAITEKRNALLGLDTLARMGRAACMDLWWMTQSPTYGDGVPRQIAKQLGTRMSLAVDSPAESRVVFGESAQEKGWKADELPMPGVALIRDGKRTPDPVKVRYMDDATVVALPDQAIWKRAEAAEDAPRPGLRLVKDAAPDYELAPPGTEDELPAAEADAVAVPAGPANNRDKVLTAVRAGARTGREVTDATGMNKGTVSKVVKSLLDAGELARAADGTLAVAAGEVSA